MFGQTPTTSSREPILSPGMGAIRYFPSQNSTPALDAMRRRAKAQQVKDVGLEEGTDPGTDSCTDALEQETTRVVWEDRSPVENSVVSEEEEKKLFASLDFPKELVLTESGDKGDDAD